MQTMIVRLVEKSKSPPPSLPASPSDQSSMKPTTQIKLPTIKINIAKPLFLTDELPSEKASLFEKIPSIEVSPSTNMVRENIGGIEVWFNPDTQKFYDLEMA